MAHTFQPIETTAIELCHYYWNTVPMCHFKLAHSYRQIYRFINEVKIATETFYNNIPSDACYVGIKSETETFIHNIFKYKYLFELCDIRPY